MEDLSKICDTLREKYELKSFSVGVDYKDKRIDVHTFIDRVYPRFTFEGYTVNFIVHSVDVSKMEEIEIPDVEELSSEEIEEIAIEEVEMPELVEETSELLGEWEVPDLENFDFEKV